MINLRLMRHPGNWVAVGLFGLFWAVVYYTAVHLPHEQQKGAHQ